MRDVNYGWLLRYVHANGASMFFIVVYIHIFRALYYGSYKAPRELLFMLGVVIFLLMMATAFMGYVLPWGQMSYWGATVITNLFSAIPLVGDSIVTLLWGGFSVDNPTLNRFFALHYLMPFMITGVVFLHIVALHITGSNNPLGIDVKTPQDTLPFHPYYTTKDSVGLCVFLLVFALLVFFAPNLLGDPDNYIPANPLVTPAHIAPEWYFRPFYAMLRAVRMEAGRRDADVRLHPGAVLPALARHLAGPQLAVPPDLQAADVAAGRRVLRAGLRRRQAAGGHLRRARPGRDGLLLPALPGAAAGAGEDRASAAAAGEHLAARCSRGPPRSAAVAGRCRRRGRQADGEAVMRSAWPGLVGTCWSPPLAPAVAARGRRQRRGRRSRLELRRPVRHL